MFIKKYKWNTVPNYLFNMTPWSAGVFPVVYKTAQVGSWRVTKVRPNNSNSFSEFDIKGAWGNGLIEASGHLNSCNFLVPNQHGFWVNFSTYVNDIILNHSLTKPIINTDDPTLLFGGPDCDLEQIITSSFLHHQNLLIGYKLLPVTQNVIPSN